MVPFKADSLGKPTRIPSQESDGDRMYSPEIARRHYPQSEIVQDKRAIMEDSTIDLIVISGAAKDDLDLVAEVLQTGKHVRLV